MERAEEQAGEFEQEINFLKVRAAGLKDHAFKIKKSIPQHVFYSYVRQLCAKIEEIDRMWHRLCLNAEATKDQDPRGSTQPKSFKDLGQKQGGDKK